jgi:hypothetical protein
MAGLRHKARHKEVPKLSWSQIPELSSWEGWGNVGAALGRPGVFVFMAILDHANRSSPWFAIRAVRLVF